MSIQASQAGLEQHLPPPDETSLLLGEAAQSSGRPPQGSLATRGSFRATARLAVTSGVGLVGDGYDLNVINLCLAILENLYPQSFSPGGRGVVASITIAGVVMGQLSFGILADTLGRKVASLTTASLTVVGAIASGCVLCTNGSAFGICSQLSVARFILGLGIGGEYPLSAALSKEMSGSGLSLTRSQLLCVNIGFFNLGMTLQAVVVLILLSVSASLEMTWRLAFVCGMVPSLVAVVMRLPMPEPRSVGASNDLNSVLESIAGFKRTILVGACICWALFNVTIYGTNSFSATLCEAFFSSAGLSTAQVIHRDAVFALVLSLFNILGSFMGLFMESHMSRRDMQFIGFLGLAFFVLLCGALLGQLQNDQGWLLAAFFAFFQMFSALVGITTYLVPTEAFPASVRGTAVGLASASGKVGACIGTAFFPVTESSFGLATVLIACSVILGLGSVVTMLMIPTSLSESVSLSGSREPTVINSEKAV